MRSVVPFLAAAALLLASASARAQTSSSFSSASAARDWTATGARTVGAGATVVTADAGWPGIGIGFLHGYDDHTDIGLRVAYNYSFFGTTNTTNGLDVTAPIRYRLTNLSRRGFEFAVHAAPGIALYSNGGTLFGVQAPVGAVAAYRMDPRTTLTINADVPLLLSFSNPVGFLFGPLVGFGGEYKIQNNLSANLQFRIGPEFFIDSNPSTNFAFQATVGLAYALR